MFPDCQWRKCLFKWATKFHRSKHSIYEIAKTRAWLVILKAVILQITQSSSSSVILSIFFKSHTHILRPLDMLFLQLECLTTSSQPELILVVLPSSPNSQVSWKIFWPCVLLPAPSASCCWSHPSTQHYVSRFILLPVSPTGLWASECKDCIYYCCSNLSRNSK